MGWPLIPEIPGRWKFYYAFFLLQTVIAKYPAAGNAMADVKSGIQLLKTHYGTPFINSIIIQT
jgi:hypothetical protein